jgi:hypothetical protein
MLFSTSDACRTIHCRMPASCSDCVSASPASRGDSPRLLRTPTMSSGAAVSSTATSASSRNPIHRAVVSQQNHQDALVDSSARKSARKRGAARKARMVGSPLSVAEKAAYSGDRVTASWRLSSREVRR